MSERKSIENPPAAVMAEAKKIYSAWEDEYIHGLEYGATEYAVEILLGHLFKLLSVADYAKRHDLSGK